MGARLKFWQRSRVSKKWSRDEAVEIQPARNPGILNSPHTSLRRNGLVEGHSPLIMLDDPSHILQIKGADGKLEKT